MYINHFTLVAGPNGAGKSTLKDEFIRPGTDYFNGDIVFAHYANKYPHLSVEQLEGGVVSTLEKLTNEAIEKRKDFAFETNFSSDMATNITKKFKENNFTANLIYIGIDSLNDCKSRITERIALGGHNVSDSQIEFNYHEGIKRVAENLSLFDNITFVDNMNIGKLKIVALSKKGLVKSILDENCKWFNSHFKSVFENLDISQSEKRSNGFKL
ncbi:MAG: zeta toxin family protein [Bacteroidales bacterium]|jgi:predicted ABC-type ATPase|nr:zeta toxin family protein [Proteiniphilum sp. UBA5218]MDD2330526.1 zeta toxin family protein [Bacteroidales bacterium]MDD3105479.1 zeta toxin family protein [Bacteroidales bacterium]MDD3550127.1 zeta toxin family protein [Bacteroidales bacterium]